VDSVSVLVNKGDGTFRDSVDYETAVGPPFEIEVADLNGNGTPDLVTPNYDSGTVTVLSNPGDGTFDARREFRVGEGAVSVAVGRPERRP